MLSVVDLDIELVLDRVMHQDARLNAELVILVVPMRLERDWDTVPAVGIDVAQSVTANLDDALGHDMRLLVQVQVVLVWVVERAHCTNGGNLLDAQLLGHLLKHLKHHFLQ